MKRLVLFLLIFVSVTLSSTAQKNFWQLSRGDLFPEIMLTTIDGELLKSEDLAGKIVFYNFYFAACAPCIAQKSVLNELYEVFHKDDVVFVSITSDDYEKTIQFRDRHEIKFKIVSLNREERGKFGVGKWPTNILVGSDGKIILKITGGRERQVRDNFSAAITSELHKMKH
jgi:peroxiredoxin